jgi:tRNA pseudouridine13 synthase
MPAGFRPSTPWPRWTSGPGAGGAWKSTPEDFLVEEIPLVEPTGEGEHQWLRVEKVGLGTLDAVDALARAAGVSPAAVGYAGLKDRDARTIQDFTIQLGKPVEDLPPGLRVLERSATRRRLRVGHLRGNRFTIRVRGGDATLAAERLARLTTTGMPNYYGVQRLGGTAPENGRAILHGGGPRLSFSQLKFALSAYQSLLFNRVLAERGSRRLAGDLVEEGDGERTRYRLAGPEDVGIPTGPMYGPTMVWPEAEARALEERVLAEEALPPGAWERFGKLTQGTRRKLWVPVDATIEPAEDGFLLRFVLPSGSYATVLLEEVL